MNAMNVQIASKSAAAADPLDSALGHALDYDVVIVGGGLVGLTLACALGQAGFNMALVEPQLHSAAAAAGQAYNLSQMTVRIFQGLGVWEALEPQLTPYTQIQLSDADSNQVVRFTPADLGTEVLGYVGEHRVILAALSAAIAGLPNVTYLCPARVEGTTVVSDDKLGEHTKIQLRSSDDAVDFPAIVRSRLVVAADGARSPLRSQAKIGTFGWPYWQACIVALIEPEHSHQNIAYERFWPSGPFAILPLPNNLCRIVWTAPKAEAEEIMTWDDAKFMAHLQQRYGEQMGQLKLVGGRSLFNVQLLQSRRYGAPRLVLIGDAAHCCHPVGGQGINLGFRDAAALAQVLTEANLRHQDLGSPEVLRRYQRWRQWENLLILAFTDLLNRTFSNRIVPMVLLRRVALAAMAHSGPLRRLALVLMNGLVGKAPAIAKCSQSRSKSDQPR